VEYHIQLLLLVNLVRGRSMFHNVFKYNKKHGPDGRFARSDGSSSKEGPTSGASAFAQVKNGRTVSTKRLVNIAFKGDKALIAEFDAKNAEIGAAVRAGKETYRSHTTNTDALVNGSKTRAAYTTERLKEHNRIINEVLADSEKYAAAEGETPSLVFLGGRGGSGKGNFDKAKGYDSGVYDSGKHLVLDPDKVKEMMKGYDPQMAYLVHRESSDIFDKIIMRARAQRLNIVLDTTMRTSVENVAKTFKKHGYEIDAHFMHLSPEAAAVRALQRWKGKDGKRGRLVPPDVVLGMVDNEKNFDKLQKYSKSWSVWANDRPIDVGPRLIADKEKGTVAKKFEELLVTVFKHNPYHGPDGRFASRGGATFVSGWGKQYANIDAKSNNSKNLVAAGTQAGKLATTAYTLGNHMRAGGELTDAKGKALVAQAQLHAAGVAGYGSHSTIFANDRNALNERIAKEVATSNLSAEQKLSAGLPITAAEKQAMDAANEANAKAQNSKKAEAAMAEMGTTYSAHLIAQNTYSPGSPEAIQATKAYTDAHATLMAYGTPEQKVQADSDMSAAAASHEYMGDKGHAELVTAMAAYQKVASNGTATPEQKVEAAAAIGTIGKAYQGYLTTEHHSTSQDLGKAQYLKNKTEAATTLAQTYSDYQVFKVSKKAGDSWEKVSEKTGVPVAEIKAKYKAYQDAYKAAEGFNKDTAKDGISKGKEIHAAKTTTGTMPVTSAAAVMAQTKAALDAGVTHHPALYSQHWQAEDSLTKEDFHMQHAKLSSQHKLAKEAFGDDHLVTQSLVGSMALSGIAGVSKHGLNSLDLEAVVTAGQGLKHGTGMHMNHSEALAKKLTDYAADTLTQDSMADATKFLKHASETKAMSEQAITHFKDKLNSAAMNGLNEVAPPAAPVVAPVAQSALSAALSKPVADAAPAAPAAGPKNKQTDTAKAKSNDTVLKNLVVPVVDMGELPKVGNVADMKMPDSKDQAMDVATAMGKQYYLMKQVKHAGYNTNNVPDEVTQAYAMYSKAKENYVSLGGSASEFSSISQGLKNTVNTEHSALKQQIAVAKINSLGGLSKAGASMAKLKDTNKGDLEAVSTAVGSHVQKLVDQGLLTHVEAATALKAGMDKHGAEKAKKAAVSTSALSAAQAQLTYNQLKHGDNKHPDVVDAANKLTAATKLHAKNLSKDELKAAKEDGHTNGTSNHASGKAFQAAYGDVGAVASNYDAHASSFVSTHNNHEAHTKAKALGQKHWTSLSADQRAALKSYTGPNFKSINQASINGTQTTVVQHLAASMQGRSLGMDLNLRRNMAQKWFFKAMGMPHGTKAEMNNMSQAQLDSLVGKTYTEPSFSSTTYNLNSGIGFSNTATESGGLTMNIRAGKDKAEGIYVDTNSSNSTEQEVVLNRGATYVIRRITKNPMGSQASYSIDFDLIGHQYDKDNA
jgi:hypothetical protein